MHEHTCAVCGTVLFLTPHDRRMGAVYCPDRPCRLYPPQTAKDASLGPWAVALHEGCGVSSHAVGRALGKSAGYGDYLVKSQADRWKKAA